MNEHLRAQGQLKVYCTGLDRMPHAKKFVAHIAYYIAHSGDRSLQDLTNVDGTSARLERRRTVDERIRGRSPNPREGMAFRAPDGRLRVTDPLTPSRKRGGIAETDTFTWIFVCRQCQKRSPGAHVPMSNRRVFGAIFGAVAEGKTTPTLGDLHHYAKLADEVDRLWDQPGGGPRTG